MKNCYRRRQLLFRSWHRGTRELDLLLGSFADKYLPSFTSSELDEYEQIIEQSDPDLYDWIVNGESIQQFQLNNVLNLLIKHSNNRIEN